MTAGLTDCAPDSLASSITSRASSRFTRLRSDLTGPIDAGRMDSVLSPMAAKHTASIGRPASSPQKLNDVSVSPQRVTIFSMMDRKDTLSVS